MKKITIKWHVAFVIIVMLFANVIPVFADSSHDKEIIQAVYSAASWETLKYDNKYDFSDTFAMKIEKNKLAQLSTQYGVTVVVEDGAIQIDGRRYDIAAGMNNTYYTADTNLDWREVINYSFNYWVDKDNTSEVIELDENTYSYVTFIGLTTAENPRAEDTQTTQYFPDDFSATRFSNLEVAVASEDDSIIQNAGFDVLKIEGGYATSSHPELFLKLVNDGVIHLINVSTGEGSEILEEIEQREDIRLSVGETTSVTVSGNPNPTESMRRIDFSVYSDGYYQISVRDENGTQVPLTDSAGREITTYSVSTSASELEGRYFVGTDDSEGVLERISMNNSYCYLKRGITYYVSVPSSASYELVVTKLRGR